MKCRNVRLWAIRLMLVAALVCGAAFAAGCGGSDDGSASKATTSGNTRPAEQQLADLGDVSLTFWQHSYPPLNDFTKKQIQEFERQHPNIKVDFQLVPFEEFGQKLQTALASRRGPQVFEADDYTFAQYRENSTISQLDPRLLGFDDYSAMAADYEPNALNLVSQDEKLYGIPYDWEAPVVGYNIKKFKAAGIDPASVTSWDAMMRAGQKMSVWDGENLRDSGFAFVHNIDDYYKLQGTTLFKQAGVNVLNADGTASEINTPEAVRVFELWRDAVFKYRTTKPGFTSSFYTEEFGRGRVGAGFMLVWANSILKPAGYVNGRDFDVIPLPTFDGKPTPSASYAWNWALNAANDDKENVASSALLSFLSRTGAAELEQAGLINPRKGWRQSLPADVQSDYREIFASLGNSEPVMPTTKFNEIWKPITDLFKEVEHDPNVDISARLAEVQQQIDDVLKS